MEKQLIEFGQLCHADVPADTREHVTFSVDGVVDQSDRVWFLEVNCNPLLHPSLYDGMLDSLFLK